MGDIARPESFSQAEVDLKRVAELVEELQNTAQELLKESGGIQALERNTRRILANVRMLQLNLGLNPYWPVLSPGGGE